MPLRRNEPIQNLSFGFLQLLGLKNTGQNPGSLGDQVSGVLEMSDWYLRTKIIEESGTSIWNGGGGAGFVPILTVPNGVIRWVEYFCAYYVTLVGNVNQMGQIYATGNPTGISGFTVRTGPMAGQLGRASGFLAGEAFQVNMVAEDWWLPAGAQIGYARVVNYPAVGNSTVNWGIRYVDLIL